MKLNFVKREYNGQLSIAAPFVGTLVSISEKTFTNSNGKEYHVATITDGDGVTRSAVTYADINKLTIGGKVDCEVSFIAGDNNAYFRLLWAEGGVRATNDDLGVDLEKEFASAPMEVVEA